jgi:hypothetical protein
MMIKKGHTSMRPQKLYRPYLNIHSMAILEDTDMFANLIAQMTYDPYLTQQVYSLCPGAGFSRDIDELSPGSRSTQKAFATQTHSKVNLSQFEIQSNGTVCVFSRGPGLKKSSHWPMAFAPLVSKSFVRVECERGFFGRHALCVCQRGYWQKRRDNHKLLRE